MVDQRLILAPQTVKVSFAVEPVLIATDTLLLLSSFDNQSGFPDWVTRTRENLPPERKHLHELLVNGMKILDHEPQWQSFPEYIDYLAALDPEALRDKSIEWMCTPEKVESMGIEPLEKEKLLGDLDVFLNFHQGVHAYYQREYGKDHDEYVDVPLLTEIHALYNDPQRLQNMAVEHLRYMWDDVLEPEWRRTLPMLEESVRAFQQLDYSSLSALDAIRVVTGRDLTGMWADKLSAIRELVFVPSAHIGPYVRLFDVADQTVGYMMFGARLPAGERTYSHALSRSELLVRLSALADDTRLQILELLAQHEELCAQDIITMLDLSQSSASRHLRQLTATGYLIEQRRDVAKCYRMNLDRVEDTLQALQRFLTT